MQNINPMNRLINKLPPLFRENKSQKHPAFVMSQVANDTHIYVWQRYLFPQFPKWGECQKCLVNE